MPPEEGEDEEETEKDKRKCEGMDLEVEGGYMALEECPKSA